MAKKNRIQRPQGPGFRKRWRYNPVGERGVKQSWAISRTRPVEKVWKYISQAVLYWLDPRRSRYSNERLRQLRAERGVGSVKRVHPRLRQSWQPTKR